MQFQYLQLLFLKPIDRHESDSAVASGTALGETPRHENHARCCVWGLLCGLDSRIRFRVDYLQPRTQSRSSFAFPNKTGTFCGRSGIFWVVTTQNKNSFCGQEQKRDVLWSGIFFGFVAFQNKNGRLVWATLRFWSKLWSEFCSATSN